MFVIFDIMVTQKLNSILHVSVAHFVLCVCDKEFRVPRVGNIITWFMIHKYSRIITYINQFLMNIITKHIRGVHCFDMIRT